MTNRITEANNKGQADSARDSQRSTNIGDSIIETFIGNPYYSPPMRPEEKEAYDDGWRNDKSNRR